MANTTSIIAAGTVIRGRISAEGDLEIHGHVEGSVEVGGTVTIGSEGLVKSDVSGHAVLVAGAVAGNLRGAERVVLEDGARVVGDVSAPSIGIRPGAKLRGRVATGEPSEAKPRATTTKAASTTYETSARAAARPAPRPTATEPVIARSAAPVIARPTSKPSVAPVTKPAGANVVAATAAAAKEPAKSEATTAKRPPEPVVPVLQKRTKKAVKRRAR
jgi:cytoskeletal protein CcmA (bactofilin family)